MRRLVWLAEVPFAGMPHRQVHLAQALASWFEVLFVEPPPPRRLPRRGVSRYEGITVAQVAPLLNARPRPLRAALSTGPARRFGGWLGARQLHLALAAAGWKPDPTSLIVVCSNVFLADALESIPAHARVVDICDDPRFYPGEPPWTGDLLVRVIRRADLVTTSSSLLSAEFTTLGARRVEYVPNGISPELLRPVARDQQASDSRRRVLGFLGYLGPWIDFVLLHQVAEALPDVDLVLVGPLDPLQATALSELQRLPNVHYAGAVASQAVSQTLSGFDVGLIPFRITAYTRAVNPLKLYEYAAQDLPIVTTGFSPDVSQFGDCVRVCLTAPDFIKAARNALHDIQPKPVRWIAESHTWPAIAERFLALITDGQLPAHTEAATPTPDRDIGLR
jgi:glycosyltransferase involved in cell wall biosynthesis